MSNFKLVPKNTPLIIHYTAWPFGSRSHFCSLSYTFQIRKPQKPLKIELSHHCQTTPTTARDSYNDDDSLCSAFLEGNTQPKQQFQIQKFYYKATTR